MYVRFTLPQVAWPWHNTPYLLFLALYLSKTFCLAVLIFRIYMPNIRIASHTSNVQIVSDLSYPAIRVASQLHLQLMAILIEAEGRCRYSETKMNKMSNRAHRIFNLVVNFKRFEKVVETTLTFVDLAGSEDIAKSGATGLTAREASHINKSLLTLGR